MNKKPAICPACGSTEIIRSEEENFDQLTLGETFLYSQINYQCNSCGEEGDFFAETDENYLVAKKAAQIKFVKCILENFSRHGISMAMIERIFDLPARTLTRWKTGDFSSSAIVFLRILITYPWIIEVAENRFDQNFATISVIKAAAQNLENETRKILNTLTDTLEIKSNYTASGFGILNAAPIQLQLVQIPRG